MSSHQTIDEILSAAAAELKERGMRGFRVRKVASLAKVSLGTITHYFPTKERLFEALVNGFVKQSWRNWETQVDLLEGGDLGPIVEGFYAVCRRHRSIVRLVVHLSARDGAIWGVTVASVVHPVLVESERALGYDRRLLAHTVINASMTYAIYDDDQLCKITGKDTIEEAHASVLAHLKGLADLSRN